MKKSIEYYDSKGLVFGVITDLHFGTSGGTTAYVDDMAHDYMNKSLIKNQYNSKISFVFDLGDFCGPNSPTNLYNWKKEWINNMMLPVFAVNGNHDVEWSDDNPYMVDVPMNETGNPITPTYAFMKNDILFLILGEWDCHTVTHKMQKLWIEYMLDLYSNHTTVICQHQSWGATSHSYESYHHVHDGDWWWDIFNNNTQIKLCMNGHNHDRDNQLTNSSNYIKNGASWGHDILFIQPSTFGSHWGNNKHCSAIMNISSDKIQFRWWGADIDNWDSSNYSWTISTSYNSETDDWFSFPYLIQDGETYVQPNNWISNNITLQLIGIEPFNFYENDGFHWVIDRKNLAWATLGEDSALAGNWDDVDYAQYLEVNADNTPINIDYPDLLKDYYASETTNWFSGVPKAIPGMTYYVKIILRTPNVAENNAFTLIMNSADKSTGDIESNLTNSLQILLDNVSTYTSFTTYHANYTVPNNNNAWFLKGQLKFLKNIDYDVKLLSIERQKTSNKTENFKIILSGHHYHAGNLSNFESKNFSVDSTNLTDNNGDINLTASINGNNVGLFRLIFNDVIFTRNFKFKINNITSNEANITLLRNISRWSNIFRVFPFRDYYNLSISPGNKYNYSNGNIWLETSGMESEKTITINFESRAIVKIKPKTQTIVPGETFNISVICQTIHPIDGFEFDLDFDETFIQVNSVTEGDIFDPFTTSFNPGTIDNVNGYIDNVSSFIMVPDSVSDSGYLVNISFTAGTIAGISALQFKNLGITNDAVYIPIVIYDGNVTVDYPPVACFNWIDADGTGTGTSITFDATCSSDDVGITLYEWDWDDDAVFDAVGMTQSHDYGDTAVHTVVLRVTDTISQKDSIPDPTVQAKIGTITVDIPLNTSWNLITVPVENSHTAITLSENNTGCLMISRFDATTQTYETYIVGGPPSFDFPIIDGYGYFILVDENSTLSLTGMPVTSVSVDLSIGWNIIGWYHNDDTTASSIGENITSCTMISWFDAVNNMFKTYIVGGSPSFDFTVSQGMGLFVLVDTASTWQGEG